MSRTSLLLSKQNFKFSSAHFLIFDESSAEMLHGHNYRVRIKMNFHKGVENVTGYLGDFHVFKKAIKEKLDQWDEHILLPAKHPDIKVAIKDKSLELRFRDRFYVFPKNEVILLPIYNTSVELLSGLLAKEFFEKFEPMGLEKIHVFVEETLGQGAVTAYP